MELLYDAIQNSGDFNVFDLDADNDIDIYDLARMVVLMYYTRMGDANLNGVVNQQDLNRIGLHWESSVNNWFDGDFNGDGFVDSVDLNILGQNWLQGHP